MDDEASHNRNVALLKDQIAKTRIDHNNIQILMRRTFPRRRMSILDGHVYNLVLDVVDEYPVLRKPSFVRCSLCVHVLYKCVYRWLSKWN